MSCLDGCAEKGRKLYLAEFCIILDSLHFLAPRQHCYCSAHCFPAPVWNSNFSKVLWVPIKRNLPDLGGPVNLFMALYRSKWSLKTIFGAPKRPRLIVEPLLLWPLITRYPLFGVLSKVRGIGSKKLEARHQWHIKLGQSHRGHRVNA